MSFFFLRLVMIKFVASFLMELDPDYQYLRYSYLLLEDWEQDALFGTWTKYNPLSPITNFGNVLTNQSNSSLIEYVTSLQGDVLVFIHYVVINVDGLEIIHHIEFYSGFKNEVIEFKINSNYYEGQWLFFYVLFNMDLKNIQVGIRNENIFQKTIITDLNYFNYYFQELDHVYGGSYMNTNCLISNFLGNINPIIEYSRDLEYIYQDNYEFLVNRKCIIDSLIVISQTILGGMQKYYQPSELTQYNYSFKFWIKIQNTNFAIGNIVKLTNNNKLDTIQWNALDLVYLHSDKIIDKVQAILSYYSYEFPSVQNTNPIIYTIQLEFSVEQALDWHYIQIEYLHEQKISFQILFPNDNISLIISANNPKQFTFIRMNILLGNSNQQINSLNFEIGNLQFYNCYEPLSNQINCHHNCNGCFGPFQNNCIDCYKDSGRIFDEITKTCNCPIGMMDTNDECYSSIGQKYIEIVEQIIMPEGYQSISPEIICSYGYFLYDSECFQCPTSRIGGAIVCVNCLINWKNWVYNPSCEIDFTIQGFVDLQNSFTTYNENHYFLLVNKELQYHKHIQLLEFETNMIIGDLYAIQHIDRDIYIICNSYSIYNPITRLCNEKQFNFFSITKCDQTNCNSFCGCCGLDGCRYCADQQKQFIGLNGLDCFECLISNCKYCFQYNFNDHNIISLEFKQQEIDDYYNRIGCALCDYGYYFNFQTETCQFIENIKPCLQQYTDKEGQVVCYSKEGGQFGDEKITIVNECSSFILHCQQCIQYYYVVYCSVCQSMYHLNEKTGLCDLCESGKQNSVECKNINQEYKDTWKEEILGFYNSFVKYPYIYDLFGNLYNTKLSALSCAVDYFISESYCQRECQPNKVCLNTEENNFCRSCTMKFYSIKLVQIETCPYLCKVCIKRSQEEIQSINPDFKVTSSNVYLTYKCIDLQNDNFFLDNKLNVVQLCELKGSGNCVTSIQKLENFNVNDDDNIVKYLNMKQVTKAVEMMRGIDNQLAFIFNPLKQQIFYLQDYILIKDGQNQVIDGIPQLELFDFEQVVIVNQSLINIPLNSLTIGANHLEFINLYFKPQASYQPKIFSQNYFFCTNQSNNLLIQNVTFQDFNFNGMHPFGFLKKYGNLTSLKIQTLRFSNCSFDNTMIFHNSESQSFLVVILQDLQLIDCSFRNSMVYSSSVSINEIIIKQFTILRSKFFDSQLLVFEQKNQILVFETLISDSQFQNSLFLQSGLNLEVSNLFALNSSFLNSSLILIKQQLISVTSIINISNMRLIDLQNCKSKLFEFSSTQSIVKVQNLIMNNLHFTCSDQLNYGVAQIFGQDIKLINIEISGRSYLTIFTLKQFKNILIDTLLVYDDDVQKKIHIFQECNTQVIQSQVLEIEQFENIVIKNMIIQSLASKDISLIRITSFGEEYINQQLHLSNITMKNNSLFKFLSLSNPAFIFVDSDILSLVNITNFDIQLNWVNYYNEFIQSRSKGYIYINTPMSQVILDNISMNKNMLTNCSKAMINVYGQSITISNIRSDYFNFYQTELKIFLIDQYLTTEQIQDIFPINNVGGIFFTESEQFTMKQVIFQHILASQGNVIYSNLLLNGIYSIDTITIRSINNKQDSTCIYIKPLAKGLNLVINNAVISDISSRYSTAFLLIDTSNTDSQIDLKNIELKNCFSFSNTILSIIGQDSKKNRVKLNNIRIINSREGLEQFLQGQMPFQPQTTINSKGNANIFINPGNVIMSKVYFAGSFVSQLVYINYNEFTKLKQVQFLNIELMRGNLIEVITMNSKSIFQMEDLIIKNVKFLQDSKSEQCQITKSIIKKQFGCEISSKTLEFEIINYNVSEIYCFFWNQFKFTAPASLVEFNVSKYILNEILIKNSNCSICTNGFFHLSIIGASIFHNIITNSLINNNVCGQNGCFKISFDNLAILRKVHFTQNQGSSFYAVDSDIYFKNSVLAYNVGVKGGAIYSQNSSIQFQQILITENSAKYGGAIYMQKYQKTISLQSDQLKQIYLQNNIAMKSMNNLADQPVRLRLLYYGQVVQSTIDDSIDLAQVNYILLPSGQEFGVYYQIDNQNLKRIERNSSILALEALNLIGEQQTQLEGSLCYLSAEKLSQNSSFQHGFQLYQKQITFNISTAMYSFEQMVLQFDPYQLDATLQIELSCDSIYDQKYKFRFNVRTYRCQMGEYYVNQTCLLCQETKQQYSVKPKATECQKANPDIIKNFTNSNIELNGGYWRSKYQSQKLERCFHNLNNCQGGWIPATESCLIGHTGALCEECDIYNIRGSGQYARSDSTNCNTCGDQQIQLIYTVFGILWLMLSNFITVQSQINLHRQFRLLKIQSKFYNILFKYTKDLSGSLLKMTINYFQILLVIQSFRLKLVYFSLQFLQQISDTSSQFSYSLDCAITKQVNFEIIYLRIIGIALLHIAYIAIFNNIFFIYFKFKKQPYKLNSLITSILQIFTVVQPNLLMELSSLMSKRSIGDFDWVQSNVQYLYNDKHLLFVYFLGIPLFIIYSFIIPVTILYKMKKCQNNINRYEGWSFLYNEFKPYFNFWESIKTTQRVLLILCLTLLQEQIIIKGITIYLILLIYTLTVIFYQPYESVTLNKYEISSLIICTIIISLSLILNQVQNTNLESIDLIIQSIIIALLFIFMLSVLLKLLRSYYSKYFLKVDLVKQYLQSKLPILKYYFPKYMKLKSSRSQIIKLRYLRIKEFLLSQVSQQKIRTQPSNLVKKPNLYQFQDEPIFSSHLDQDQQRIFDLSQIEQ